MSDTPSRRAFLGAAASLGCLPATLFAASVGPALDRPALALREPERAVLLAATAAGESLVAVGERGLVLASADGARWRQQPSPVSVTLTAVRFSDARNGMATGHSGVVLATTDGGQSWTRCLDGMRLAQSAVAEARASGQPAALRAAEQLVQEGADKPLMDLVLFDARRALVVGAYGVALLTEDGGASWTSIMAKLDNPRGAHLYAVRCQGQRVLIAGEQGIALLSEDGARSWRRLVLPYQGSFFTAELLADGAMLLAGLRGNAWFSNDQGASWTQLVNPMAASITASIALADGRLLLANQAGFVLTRKQGALTPLNAVPLPSINGLAARGQQPLALTQQGPMPVTAVSGERS